MNYTTRRKLNKYSKLVLVGAFWIAFWQVLALVVGNSLLLPSVPETMMALISLVGKAHFYMDAGWTLLRCVASIVLPFVFGIVFAWGAYKKELVRGLMTLPVSFFKAVPVMAIVIYVILVVKADWVAVVACFLMCFPIVYTNILEGLDEVSKELLEVTKVYEFGKLDTVKLVHVPSVIPHFNAAMKIVAGLSWKAVVAAEVLSVPEFSLGQGMISAKYYLETPTLFAYIFVIVVLSLTLEKAIVYGTSRLTVRNYEGSKLSGMNRQTCHSLEPVSINITNVNKAFGEKQVLTGLSKLFEADKKTAVVGPSGRGKTTLVRIIAGLETADSGNVEFSGRPEVSYLFQEDRLFPWLNVYDNMALGMNIIDSEAIIDMAKKLEIEEVLYKMPDELSGGMKHRVSLGRTFLAESNLMILDEPFRGLDEGLKRRIVDRLWEKTIANKTVIVISHSQSDIEMLGIVESIFVE